MKRILPAVMAIFGVAGCSSGVGAGDTSQKVSDGWTAKWCQVQPGHTKEALVASMGPPTRSGPTFMTWAADQHQFNAFLEADGKIEQLDINLAKLSDAEKAALPCSNMRTRESVAAAAAPPARPAPRACALLSDAEMSSILGAAVVGEPTDRSPNQTKCTYQPASGASPSVELAVDWGGGEAAMTAMGLMGRIEPGLANPYEGLGDQAAAIGPMLMIRTGDDLVKITFSGVSGTPGKARQIFEIAKGKM
jgi:hypothetical protein